MKRITINIEGMHCASCAKLIESDLNDIGVKSEINSMSGKAILEFDEKKVSENKIKEIVRGLGYKVK